MTARRYPFGLVPVGQAYQRQIAMGMGAPAAAARVPPIMEAGADIENDPRFTKIPAWYVCTVSLAGTVGATGPGNVQLRPELFVLKRISWATTGDVYPYADVGASAGFSVQGRAVTIAWSDEFTKFMGNSPGLVSSVFGDSNGFLDLPRAALFQGSQTLGLTLTRLFWPSQLVAAVTRWDFTFTGFGLLPKNVNQSGTAG